MRPVPVVVLVSGRGSNLEALIHAQGEDFAIAGVISNNPDVGALAYAQNARIPGIVVDHLGRDRAAFEAALAAAIDAWAPRLVVLAGFMRILSGAFVARYQGRLINIHPSLLPRFRGLNTHERVLAAGVKWHGASVHYVTAEVDGGPVIAQIRLRVRRQDTPASLARRLLPLEHRLLPYVVSLIATERICYARSGIELDGTKLSQPLRLAAGSDLDPDPGDER